MGPGGYLFLFLEPGLLRPSRLDFDPEVVPAVRAVLGLAGAARFRVPDLTGPEAVLFDRLRLAVLPVLLFASVDSSPAANVLKISRCFS